MPEIRVSVPSEVWQKLQRIRELGPRKPDGSPEITEDTAVAKAVHAFWELQHQKEQEAKKGKKAK